MRFLRRASSFLNNLRSSSDGSNLISSIGGFLSKISLLHVGLFAIPVLIILIIFLTLMSLFNYKINLLQMVDNGEAYSSSSSSLVAGDHMSIVEAAKTQLGQPYCYIGSAADPGGCGFNCSGLTWWAYEKAGYKIPHAQGYRSEFFSFNGENSQAYWVHSKGHWKNNIDECNPGDLVFFSHSGTWQVTYHVGIYMGEHKMIHSGGSGVHISDYNSSGDFVGCGWPLEYDSYSGGNFPNESSKLAYQRIRNVESSTGMLVAVDYDRNYVHVFKGSKGSWELEKSFQAVTGKNRYFGYEVDRNGYNTTPVGLFHLSSGIDVVSTQHNQYTLTYTVRINSNKKGGASYFHGLVAGFISKSANPDNHKDLIPKYINKNDNRVSGGCVMLKNDDAKWLFNTVKKGTTCYIWTEKPATNNDGFENKKLKKIMVDKGYNDVSKLTADDRLHVYGSSGPLPYPVVSY